MVCVAVFSAFSTVNSPHVEDSDCHQWPAAPLRARPRDSYPSRGLLGSFVQFMGEHQRIQYCNVLYTHIYKYECINSAHTHIYNYVYIKLARMITYVQMCCRRAVRITVITSDVLPSDHILYIILYNTVMSPVWRYCMI